MTVESKALPIPPELLESGRTDDVSELIRIWWGGDRPQMILRPVLNDERMVGSVLAEAAWHFSRAYAERRGLNQEEVLDTIRQSWTEAHDRSAGIRAAAAAGDKVEASGETQ
ncbi:MAG: DUF5076 domain-containing protein [Alphaproteobacteria bacterium]|nr:DUF5076 domain-containing protein [Alphaproteobacteria bacterium]